MCVDTPVAHLPGGNQRRVAALQGGILCLAQRYGERAILGGKLLKYRLLQQRGTVRLPWQTR